MTTATLADVVSVMQPGETLLYTELLERMHKHELPTAGIGTLLRRYEFQKHGAIANALVCSWREPYWDDENVGAWTEGVLRIARKPKEETHESD